MKTRVLKLLLAWLLEYLFTVYIGLPNGPIQFASVRKIWVYLGVRTCELFLCFVAIVRVRVYYVDFFVFFELRH